MNNEWDDALSAFFDPPANKNPDPKPLANLLRGDQRIPKIARSMLAEAIDQTLPFRGNWRLPAPVWDGALDKFHDRAVRNVSIGTAMESEVREGAPTDETAETVGTRFGIGKRQVMNIWSDWKDGWHRLRGSEIAELERGPSNSVYEIISPSSISVSAIKLWPSIAETAIEFLFPFQ